MIADVRALTSTEMVRRSIEGRRFSPINALVAFMLLFTLLTSVVILVTLLADTITAALPVFEARGFSFITDSLSPSAESAGISQGIMGSLALTGFVIVVAFPLGVAAAVYLEEYASDNRVTRFINANIRNLAGVPSIVYGILGLFLFVEIMMRGIFGTEGGIAGRNVIAGGLTLAVLVLPIMIITTSEALRAVPGGLREASLAVGATRWETIRHHVLPVAFPAILTGSVLTIARAFGESAPLLLAGAQLSLFFSVANDASFVDLVSNQPYTALPIIIFNFARQPQEEFVALTAAAIVVLLVMLLTVNAAAVIVRDRFERRYR
ncbi:MAG TPA: phosphate ABC transporter permease PstA [Acidimicrobiia bacterium]|nr:phosphate ABC transporter permease PstA [Acidimicrobiia bacterium]